MTETSNEHHLTAAHLTHLGRDASIKHQVTPRTDGTASRFLSVNDRINTITIFLNDDHQAAIAFLDNLISSALALRSDVVLEGVRRTGELRLAMQGE